MTNDHSLLFSKPLDKPNDVANQMKDGVVIDRLRCISSAVAPLIRRHNSVTGIRQRMDLMPPGIPGLGKPMTEHHKRSTPGLNIVHIDPV